MQRDPQQFGKYLLLERISVGGMAEVFKAKAFGVEGFEKILAIKRILPNMVDDSDFIEMFIDEAKIAGQLNHANICQIFELGRFEKAHYIAMEYISGKDLLQITGAFQRMRRPMPIPVACFIVAKLCEGLDYAHRKKDNVGNPLNIIHRDVSPQNVLVSYEGEVKLIDFGIAKARYRSSKTAAGVLKGKFGYMSPEQVRGLRLDRRTDVFSLGTLLFEMATGSRLFGGDTDFAVLEKVRNGDIPRPSSLNPQINQEFERVILRALAKTPEDRHQWANELHDDLQKIMLQNQPLVTTKRLSAFMKENFAEDIRRERADHERYLSLTAQPPPRPAAPPPPPPPSQGSSALPDFDAYDEEEETALMKERGVEDYLGESTGVGSEDGTVKGAYPAEPDEEASPDSTVILWSEEGEESSGATMILPDDGAGLPPSAAAFLKNHPSLAADEPLPNGATMILEDGLPPEGATMILQDGGLVPEGATKILSEEDDVVDGIPLAQLRQDAAFSRPMGPGAAPGGPQPLFRPDLPPPRPEEDIFGVAAQGGVAPGPQGSLSPVATPHSTGGTAKTRAPAPPARRGGLMLALVGALGIGLGALVMGLVKSGGPAKPAKPQPPPAVAAVLVKADADVAVTVDGKHKLRTGSRGAVIIEGLAPGKHKLAFEAAGFKPQKAAFELEEGQAVLLGPYALERLEEAPRPATLVIQLSDMFRDAEVSLDDLLLSQEKLGKPIEVPGGKTVSLRVSLLGYEDHVQLIQTQPGQRVETKPIALAEDRLGQVAVRTAPVGAAITVNGKPESCVTPCRVRKLDPKKKFKLKLTLKGYRPHEGTYSFPPDERTRIVVVSLKEVAEAGSGGGSSAPAGARLGQ